MTSFPAAVVETHTAVLFFVDDRVYKLKKAVDLGFLDHRTRRAREAACHQEVALNRRLAPDVYLGVLDVTGEDGEVQDHLVAMRRMPDERRLSRCLERGEDLERPLRAIAHQVAALHELAPPDPAHDRLASPEAVRARWTDGFDQLHDLPARPDTDLSRDLSRDLQRIEVLALRYLDGRSPLLEQRIADGRIRDGHGDLQAEDIFVLDDGPRILDCIEFGEDYRWGDVLADVAFLAMDLERLGRPDLGDRFLALHRELSADRWPASLAHHLVAYRAHVRVKVGLLRAAQHDEPPPAEVRDLVRVALRHLEAGRVRLILVGGLPGTGKSTLAAALGDHLGAVVLRTDEVRRRLAVGDDDSAGDRYRPQAVAAVYHEVLAEARHLLALGEQVVLDATWADEAERSLARDVAAQTSSDLVELVCTLPRDQADDRIRQRAVTGLDPSEATPAVAATMAGRFAPWPEAAAISTSAPADTTLAAAVAVLEGWS